MSAAPAAPRREEEEEEGSDPVNITVTWRGLPNTDRTVSVFLAERNTNKYAGIWSGILYYLRGISDDEEKNIK